MSDLRSHYPFPTFRKYIPEALDAIEASFNKGNKVVILDAPVGSGKSAVAYAVASKYGGIIITGTKFLQDQYINTPQFKGVYSFKGKSEYKCGLPGQRDISVDMAVCQNSTVAEENKDLIPFAKLIRWNASASKAPPPNKQVISKCKDMKICPYFIKRHNLNINTPILNHHSFFSLLLKPSHQTNSGEDNTLNSNEFTGRVLIVDEAHMIINVIQSRFGNNFVEKKLVQQFGKEAKRKRLEDWYHWIKRINNLAKLVGANDSNNKKAKEALKVHEKIKMLLALDITNDSKFYVEDNLDGVIVKPTDYRFFAKKILKSFDKIVFMSATFQSNFAYILGLDGKDISTEIIVPYTFPKKNRRILYPSDIPSINYRTNLTKSSKQVKMIRSILDAFPNDKGIVHCANYNMFRQLQQQFSSERRFLWVAQGENKQDKINIHKRRTDGTVLVSPSMMEGVDLKDDLARFQIMLKLPYPALDGYNKSMDKRYPGWYSNQTIMAMIQAYGRAVRSPTDQAMFFLLDGAFEHLSKRNKINPYFFGAMKSGTYSQIMAYLEKKAEENK